MQETVPYLKKKTLEERITFGLDSATKLELETIKQKYRVDTSEWIRSLIRAELPKLKKAVSA